jgi:hypothetical protein
MLSVLLLGYDCRKGKLHYIYDLLNQIKVELVEVDSYNNGYVMIVSGCHESV